MATAKIEYLGGLRTNCTHLRSGEQILTDAPVDNKGKGEAFSPTDLVATAYVSCMLSIIGIYCNENNISYVNGTGEVTKVMGPAPRRISRLEITLNLEGNDWSEEVRERIKRVAEACPVAQSIHPNIEVAITYIF